ncbi:MAG: hypothetical protein CVU05_06170 [Bacteroidetes bacterium HGW-Bacteroidetes-21]|jgi:hypothetical protein|nr:MAG: hypothetical protein CVU05_06170 [Bacteroidetes bacterium HGW-Bacteroidetes-21]
MKLRGGFYYSGSFKKLLLLVWAICISFLLTYLGSLLVARLIWGPEVFDITFLTNTSNPTSVNVMKFLQVFNTLGLFMFPALLMAWLTYPNVAEYFGTGTKIRPLAFVFIPLLALALLPLSNYMTEINQMLSFPDVLKDFEQQLRAGDKASELLTLTFVKADSLSVLFINIFVIAVVPAIAEEFFFRGVLQKLFTQWSRNIHMGIVLTAIVFSLVHFQFFSFLPRFFLGVVFGYLLYYSGSIWVPVIAHFVNNATAIIVYYMIQNGSLPTEAEHMGCTDTIVWMFTGLAVSVLSFWIIVRKKPIRMA